MAALFLAIPLSLVSAELSIGDASASRGVWPKFPSFFVRLVPAVVALEADILFQTPVTYTFSPWRAESFGVDQMIVAIPGGVHVRFFSFGMRGIADAQIGTVVISAPLNAEEHSPS